MAKVTVKKGDTLSKIAKANNTTVAAIAKENNIKDVNKIYAGSSLNIPGSTNNTNTGITNNNGGATPPPANDKPTFSGPSFEDTTAGEAYGKYVKGEAEQEIDEAKIRSDVLNRYQGEIDASKKYFAQKLATEQVAGRGRLGSESAIQARRGLLGSDFGSARTDVQVADYMAKEDGIRAEENIAISKLLTEARTVADAEIAAKKAARKEGLTSYMEYLNNAQTRKAERLKKVATAFITQKIDPLTMDATGLSNIAKGYNVSVDELKSEYIEQKAAKDKADKEEQDKLIKDRSFDLSEGESRYVFDPATGKYNLIASKPKTYAPGSGGGVGGGVGSGGTFKSDMDFLYNSIRTTKNSKTVELLDSAWRGARNDTDRINILAQNVALPAEIKKDVIQRTAAIPMLDSALKLIDDGVKTGFFTNLGESAFNKFGETTNPQLVKMRQYIISAIQPYRSSITGAAWGTQEENEYRSLFGSTLDNPALLKTKLETLRSLMQQSNISTIASGLSLADPSIAGQYLGGGTTTAPTITPTEASVKMVGPNGQVGMVPASKVEAAKAKGYRVAQ